MKKNIIALSTTTAFWTPRLSLSLLLLLTFTSPSLAQVKKAEIIGSPTFKDDRVTIRIKVKGGDDRPVMGLEDSNFKLTVDKKEVKLKPKDWKSPEETVPPPAWIVVLLDFSGSMNQVDSGGTKKNSGCD